MSQITKPASEIDVTIQGQNFKVKYPTSGEMIDISTLKAKLSDGQYTQLLIQRSNESGISLKLIDTYCFLSTMLPDLKSKLNVKSLYDLEIIDSVELIHVYDSVIVPWMEKWTEVINKKISEFEGVETGKRGLV